MLIQSRAERNLWFVFRFDDGAVLGLCPQQTEMKMK